MKSKSTMKITGRLRIFINDKLVRDIKNLVVTTGKDWITSRMQGTSDLVMSHIAIGTGGTAAIISDTILETENARVALDVAGGSVVGAVITFAATIPAGSGTGAIKEAGILNAASAGDLLSRTVFAVVTKGMGDSMSISWDVTIT